MVAQNCIWGYGRRMLFMVELDYEAKGKKSIFSIKTPLFEQHRQLLLSSAKREIKRGWFARERNIG